MPQTTAIDGTGPVLVRVVSDGTTGMRLQALALAESLQRARPDWKCDEFTITPHPLTRAMPRLAAWLPSMPLYGSTPPGRGTGSETGRRTGGMAGGRGGELRLHVVGRVEESGICKCSHKCCSCLGSG